MTFLVMFSVILLSMLMMLLSTLSLIRHLICGFWTWIWSTRHWAGKGSGLLISVLEKLVSFDWCYGCEKGWIFGKIMLYRRCWGWLSLLNRIRALSLPLLRKLPRRKLEPRFVLLSFFLLKLLRISINLTDGHAWNNVVMSGERLLVAN